MNVSQLKSLMEISGLLGIAQRYFEQGFSFFTFEIESHSYLISFDKKGWFYYQLFGGISSGDNGSVRRAVDLITGESVAVKSTYLTYDCLAGDVKLLKAKYCGEAQLAIDTLGKHPAVIQLFSVGIAAFQPPQGSLSTTGCLQTTIMELAEPLSKIQYIRHDFNNSFAVLMRFYDALQKFERLGILFTDLSKGSNLLLRNGTNVDIVITDFDDNLIKRPPDAHHNLIMFLEIIHYNLFSNTADYDDEYTTFFNLRKQLISFLRNPSIHDREFFYVGLKKILNEYYSASCKIDSNCEAKWQEKFTLFSKPSCTDNSVNPNLSSQFFSSMLGILLLQLARDAMKKMFGNNFCNNKKIDYAFIAISLVLVFSSFQTAQSLAIPFAIICAQLLCILRVIPKAANHLIPFVLIISATIQAFINHGAYQAGIRLQSSLISLLGTAVGNIIYQLAFKSDNQIEPANKNQRI